MKTLPFFLSLLVAMSLSGQVTTQKGTADANGFYQWNNSANWVGGTQPNPLTTLIDEAIVVNRYITTSSGLTFDNIGNNSLAITVNDTLVVQGDVFFDNNAISLINNGVIVVFGNFRSDNKADITNNGTMVVTGNLTLNGGQQDYNDGNGSGGGIYVGGTVSGNSSGVASANNDKETDLGNYGSEMEDFVTGGGSSPLPVELTSFEVARDSDGVRLVWHTASEKNNDYFSVERSENGTEFYEIGRVEGHGTTDIAQVYSFLDRSPISKIEYYRLRQVDFDGQFEIHKTVVGYSNELATQVSMDIYPNPASERIALKTIHPVTYQYIKLVDQSGKVVVDFDTETSGLILQRDLPKLKSGLYFIKYETTSGISGIQKLMIR